MKSSKSKLRSWQNIMSCWGKAVGRPKNKKGKCRKYTVTFKYYKIIQTWDLTIKDRPIYFTNYFFSNKHWQWIHPYKISCIFSKNKQYLISLCSIHKEKQTKCTWRNCVGKFERLFLFKVYLFLMLILFRKTNKKK